MDAADRRIPAAVVKMPAAVACRAHVAAAEDAAACLSGFAHAFHPAVAAVVPSPPDVVVKAPATMVCADGGCGNGGGCGGNGAADGCCGNGCADGCGGHGGGCADGCGNGSADGCCGDGCSADPSCGCENTCCGGKSSCVGILSKIRARLAANRCRSACGCAAAPSCGCAGAGGCCGDACAGGGCADGCSGHGCVSPSPAPTASDSAGRTRRQSVARLTKVPAPKVAKPAKVPVAAEPIRSQPVHDVVPQVVPKDVPPTPSVDPSAFLPSTRIIQASAYR